MSFDVYVGSFTRYIGGDWENMGQRQARELGVEYKLIRDNQTEEAPPPPDEVREAVSEWLAAINEALGEHIGAPLAWSESDETPYFTARPGWEGYSALLLHAAHDDHPSLARPTRVPDEWGEDPAYLASTGDDGETRYPAILLADLWLPGAFDFLFRVEDLGGNDRAVASTVRLLEELKDLDSRTFQSTPAQLAAWRARGSGPEASFDDNARAGLAVLIALADEAVQRGLPLMPDY
jgi:hypothetical protein